MHFNIGLIAPYKKLIYETKKISQLYSNVSIIAKYAYLEDALKISKQMEKDGCDVIITRVGTDLYLNNEINIPIVPIPVSSTDLLKAFIEARKVSGRIAIANYNDRFKDMDILIRGVNHPIKHFSFSDRQEAEIEINKIFKDIDVIIGGGYITSIASNFGLKSALIETSKESIHYAIEVACNMAKAKWEEKLKYNSISTIINQSAEGIIAVDKNFNIIAFNQKAKEIFRITYEEQIENIKQEILDVLGIYSCINNNKRLDNKIIEVNNKKLIINTDPIAVENVIFGAVCSFQNIKQIQNMEGNIRYNLHKKGLNAKYHFHDIDGNSDAVIKAICKAKKYAKTNFSVIIFGETGTGKELFAQSLHNYSERKNKPFVAINCATIPSNLLESELFGYEGGSFTGAKKEGKPGLFEVAHTGTIFLDEIGDLPLNVQGHLLRVIQEKEVIRLGGNRIIPIDVRIISATNVDLVDKIDKGMFREDLYYRLNTLNITLPPLRERDGDINIIAKHILMKHNIKCNDIKVITSALSLLYSYHWGGNIRELQNLLFRIIAMLDSKDNAVITYNEVYEIIKELYPKHFNKIGTKDVEINLRDINDINTIKSSVEKDLILSLINQGLTNNEIMLKLGISRTTLWRRFKKYDLKN